MYTRLLLLSLLPLGLLVAGCFQERDHFYSPIPGKVASVLKLHEDSHTVRHTVDLSPITPRKISPTQVLGTTGDSLLFGDPNHVITGGDDFVMVDQANHNIVVFDPEGRKPSRTIGTQGQAPGEFNKPASIAFADNKYFVYDQGNRRIQTFDTNFDHISSFVIEQATESPICFVDNKLLISGAGYSADGNLVSIIDPDTPLGPPESYLRPIASYEHAGPLALNNVIVTGNKNGHVISAYMGLPYLYVGTLDAPLANVVRLTSPLFDIGLQRLSETYGEKRSDLPSSPVVTLISNITLDDNDYLYISIKNNVFKIHLDHILGHDSRSDDLVAYELLLNENHGARGDSTDILNRVYPRTLHISDAGSTIVTPTFHMYDPEFYVYDLE